MLNKDKNRLNNENIEEEKNENQKRKLQQKKCTMLLSLLVGNEILFS